MADSDTRLQRFNEFLAGSGPKCTRQREGIVRAFFAPGRHLSAEEPHHRVHTESPRIGLVGVYRTLKLLREARLATGRQFGTAYRPFDLNPTDRPHGHLLCTPCGKIQESEDAILGHRRAKVARTHGFRVTEHKLELYGFCHECARLAKGRPVRNGRATR
jgi:Fur family transcriptional regulator, ferric uptake regulator